MPARLSVNVETVGLPTTVSPPTVCETDVGVIVETMGIDCRAKPN